MAEATGIGAIVAEARGDAPIVPAEPEQIDLLAQLGLQLAAPERRPRGRPAGAINRRTERVAEYLLSKYPDPLEGLMQMAALGVDEMAAALNVSKFEAFQELRLCRVAALPFVHRRMPLAVDLTNNNVVHLSINTGVAGVAAASGEAGLTILGTLATIEENQEVSDGTDAPV